jgi:hypothetical protein
VINLLLEKWDEQRSVKRLSAYARFDIDRKVEFLAYLAYTLTTTLRSTTFGKWQLLEAYKAIYDNFSLPSNEAGQVVSELESHNGLFIQSGAEMYEFSHKSLQEYLTAEYIVRLPSMPHESSVLVALPNELAIASAISSRPSDYLSQLVLSRFAGLRLGLPFLRTFIGRLFLERPDVELTWKAGVALLSLYSQYFEALAQDQRAAGRTGELGSEIEELEQMIRSRITGADFHEVFRTDRSVQSGSGRSILRMAKVRSSERSDAIRSWKRDELIKSSSNDMRRDLPSVIWISPSLFQTSESQA